MAKPTSTSRSSVFARFQSEGTLGWIPDLMAIAALVAIIAIVVGTFA
ncbi:MAG: hypothetical protein ACI9MC_001735 [Kiritimatiellia bacterium]|jgi:hypothetical protein